MIWQTPILAGSKGYTTETILRTRIFYATDFIYLLRTCFDKSAMSKKLRLLENAMHA